MNYYENEKDWQVRGIDYDLHACLEYNPRTDFDVNDIKNVLAVWEGENDGDDWRWVFQLKDGRFVFLQGGCDYTGWDCQSWATHAFADTPEAAAEFALGKVSIETSSPADAGFGHLLNLLGGTYDKNFKEVYQSLFRQIQLGKEQTWTEKKAVEFALDPVPTYFKDLKSMCLELVSGLMAGLLAGGNTLVCVYCGAKGRFAEEGGLMDAVSPSVLHHMMECPLRRAREALGLTIKSGKWQE